MKITVTQEHSAEVEQITTYELPDDKLEEFRALDAEADRERFLWDHATEVGDETNIGHIHETERVEVAEVAP